MGIEPMTTRCLVVALTTKLLGREMLLITQPDGARLAACDHELLVRASAVLKLLKSHGPENWPRAPWETRFAVRSAVLAPPGPSCCGRGALNGVAPWRRIFAGPRDRATKPGWCWLVGLRLKGSP